MKILEIIGSMIAECEGEVVYLQIGKGPDAEPGTVYELKVIIRE